MKKTMMLGLAAVAMSLSSITTSAQNKVESLDIGANLPTANDKLRSVDGKEVTLKGATTKNGLIVMFSCNTCPYVVKSQERTKQVMKFAKEKGVGMVIINSNEAKRDGDDSYAEMKSYARAQGYNVPYVVDEKSHVADAFGANRTPEVFLFDKSGKLVYKGAMDDNPTSPSEAKQMFLQDAVNNMISGKPADPSTTKSVGCSIKRAS